MHADFPKGAPRPAHGDAAALPAPAPVAATPLSAAFLGALGGRPEEGQADARSGPGKRSALRKLKDAGGPARPSGAARPQRTAPRSGHR